jgi:hypothetical protein
MNIITVHFNSGPSHNLILEVIMVKMSIVVWFVTLYNLVSNYQCSSKILVTTYKTSQTHYLEDHDWRFHIMFAANNTIKLSQICKGKVVLFTCPGGTLGERTYCSYSFLASAVDTGERSASSRSCAPQERAHNSHCTGGWVGPRASLDAEGRGKILYLSQGLNYDCPVHSQALYWQLFGSHSRYVHLHKI